MKAVTVKMGNKLRETYTNNQRIPGLPFVGFAKAWIGGELVDEIYFASNNKSDLEMNLEHWARLQADESSVDAQVAQYAEDGDTAYEFESIW